MLLTTSEQARLLYRNTVAALNAATEDADFDKLESDLAFYEGAYTHLIQKEISDEEQARDLHRGTN